MIKRGSMCKAEWCSGYDVFASMSEQGGSAGSIPSWCNSFFVEFCVGPPSPPAPAPQTFGTSLPIRLPKVYLLIQKGLNKHLKDTDLF